MSEKAILRIDNAQKYYNRGRENEIHVMNRVWRESEQSASARRC